MAKPRRLPVPASVGTTVNADGSIAIDPTENVKELVAAALESLAALRAADKELSDAKHEYTKEIIALRAQHADQLRTSDLKAADKTREVDVLAGAASAAALATAVSALAATADRNAETLRNQLNTTAATMAKQTSDLAASTQLQTDNLFRRTDERVAALERAANLGAGRSSVVDPQMSDLLTKFDKMLTVQSQSTGKSAGFIGAWGILVGAVGLIAALAALFFRATGP